MLTQFTVLFNKVEQLTTNSQSEAFNRAKTIRRRASKDSQILVLLNDGVRPAKMVYNQAGKSKLY